MLRLTATGAALIAVTYGLARFALGLFVPELRDEFGLSGTATGAIMASSYGGYLAALALAGAAIARAGARTVAIAGGLLAALGTAGIAAAPSAPLLAVAAGLGGMSTGWASTALAAAVQSQVILVRRAAVQTMVNAGTSLGLIVAAPAAVLAGTVWRAPWLLFSAAAVVVTVVTAGAIDRAEPVVGGRPGTVDQRPSGPASLDAGWRVSPRLACTALLLGLSSAPFWTFGRDLVEVTAGLQPAASRMMWLAVGAGGLIGAAAGSAARRHGLGSAVAASWVGFAVAQVGLAAGGTGLVGAASMAALFGAGYMALTGLLIVWAVRERPHGPGAAVAVAFFVLAAGQIAGSPLAGVLVDTVGLASAFVAAAGAAAIALVTLPTTAAVVVAPAGPR